MPLSSPLCSAISSRNTLDTRFRFYSMHRRSMLSPTAAPYVSRSHGHAETSSTERSMGGGTGGLSLTATGGVMIAATLVSFALFVLLLCLCLRRKRCWGAIPAVGRAGPVAEAAGPAAPVSKGIDACAVRALPSFVFSSAGSAAEEAPLECSVCLAELADGESALRLPRCGHGFHLECIEAWLRSHSSCPLCRCPVLAGPPEVPDLGTQPLGARIPPVVPGDGRASGSAEDVVLEVPSPASALPLPGLSSLRWLLMLGGRGVGSPRCPTDLDVEQGAGAPKTPAT